MAENDASVVVSTFDVRIHSHGVDVACSTEIDRSFRLMAVHSLLSIHEVGLTP
jgi:hypothetical protein